MCVASMYMCYVYALVYKCALWEVSVQYTITGSKGDCFVMCLSSTCRVAREISSFDNQIALYLELMNPSQAFCKLKFLEACRHIICYRSLSK